MEDKYLSPCRTDEICKGCTLKRSCQTKTGIPNCIKQFMDGTAIKKEINDNQQELDRLKAALSEAQKAERFLGYLVEECEGNTITEDYLISKMDDMLKSELNTKKVEGK